MVVKRFWLVTSALVLLGFSLGCGSSSMAPPPPPPPPKSEFVYALTFQPPNNSQLLAFKMDLSSGALTSPSSIAAPLSFGLAVDPATKFLYLSDANPVTPAIDIFAVDSKTGSLKANGSFILTVICPFCPPMSGPGAVAMDVKGKSLYYGSNTFGGGLSEVIGALSVNAASGMLNGVPGTPFPADDVPFGVLVHPSGHFVYTENTPNQPVFPLALQGISGFSIEPVTGALAPLPGSPFAPPQNADLPGFAIHPSGKFLYASTSAAANGVLAWAVDSGTGTLTVLPGSPFAAGTTPSGVTIDPTGRFLYSSNGAAGGILGFAIDAGSGILSPMNGSPFLPSIQFSELVADPSGQLLVAVDAKNEAIASFKINSSTGAITQLGSPTPIGAITFSVVVAKVP